MKKGFICLVVLLSYSVVPLSKGQILNYTNGFEGKSNGYAITNDAEWSTANAIATVTNLDYSAKLNTAYMGTPLSGTHSGVLSFSDGVLTNSTSGGSFASFTIDTMVLPSFMQDIVADTAISNSGCSLCFTTNGAVALYHGMNLDNSYPFPPAANVWSTLAGMSVTSGKWVRLTLNFDCNAVSGYYTAFQIRMDGVLLTSSHAYKDNATFTEENKGGSWFLTTSSGSAAMANKLNRLVLSGTGMIDDLAITSSDVPAYITSSHQIPYNWFLVTGVTNDSSSSAMAAAESDSADADGDGMPNWAEYFAGTEPTNSTSRLIIVSQTISNGVPIIQWLGSANALADYTIAASTNLTNVGGWSNVAVKAKAGGTNTYVLTGAPAVSPGFFRVSVIK